jgi:hypothetical protein
VFVSYRLDKRITIATSDYYNHKRVMSITMKGYVM